MSLWITEIIGLCNSWTTAFKRIITTDGAYVQLIISVSLEIKQVENRIKGYWHLNHTTVTRRTTAWKEALRDISILPQIQQSPWCLPGLCKGVLETRAGWKHCNTSPARHVNVPQELALRSSACSSVRWTWCGLAAGSPRAPLTG